VLGGKTAAQNVVKEIKQKHKMATTVKRVERNGIPKQALQYRPKGRRNKGRPRKRWGVLLHLED
jgi:hypothetical protein